MDPSNINRIFREMTAPLAAELDIARAKAQSDAFHIEPREVPPELTDKGIPLGHIAFMGDFDAESV